MRWIHRCSAQCLLPWSLLAVAVDNEDMFIPVSRSICCRDVYRQWLLVVTDLGVWVKCIVLPILLRVIKAETNM